MNGVPLRGVERAGQIDPADFGADDSRLGEHFHGGQRYPMIALFAAEFIIPQSDCHCASLR